MTAHLQHSKLRTARGDVIKATDYIPHPADLKSNVHAAASVGNVTAAEQETLPAQADGGCSDKADNVSSAVGSAAAGMESADILAEQSSSSVTHMAPDEAAPKVAEEASAASEASALPENDSAVDEQKDSELVLAADTTTGEHEQVEGELLADTKALQATGGPEPEPEHGAPDTPAEDTLVSLIDYETVARILKAFVDRQADSEDISFSHAMTSLQCR
jgi:hypothetical protein